MMPEVKDMTDMGLDSAVNLEAEELIGLLEEPNARLLRKIDKQRMIVVALKGLRKA